MPKSPFEPCIPTRAAKVPDREGWLHEIKHDGYRLIVQREAKRVRLFTRNGHDWSDRYPLISEAAQAARLPDGATIYCLWNTAITRALLANVSVRLVASRFDTSVAVNKKTYTKCIAYHSDSMMRRALFDVNAPAAGNVVPLLVL
jgi:hypothetical protein